MSSIPSPLCRARGSKEKVSFLKCLLTVTLLKLVFCVGAATGSNAADLEREGATGSIQHPSMVLESSLAAGALAEDTSYSVKEQRRNFVSSTLGSNMVLQRDRPVVLWGFASQPGAVIEVELDGDATVYLTEASQDPSEHGLWRLQLPPRAASLEPVNLRIQSPDTGQEANLTNILFGDVYVCGGQSNMQFSIPVTTNATEEAKKADDYPHIRLFTVGQGTESPDLAMDDLQTVEQRWSVASAESVMGPNGSYAGFSYFSSVCWFFGREISDGLEQKIPIGLISNNWGGTSVKLWVPGGKLYNAMIHPYLVGPMTITGFTWYQGEADTASEDSAAKYAIRIQHMIDAWRSQFGCPDSQDTDNDCYFGFVQLSTWCHKSIEAIPWMRHAQMFALKRPGKIGYATNADHGAGCNIHPPAKQFCGARLGQSALALQYGQYVHWKSPSYRKSTSSKTSFRDVSTENPNHGQEEYQKSSLRTLAKVHTTTTEMSVEVVLHLQDVSSSKGLYLLDEPYNSLDGTFDCSQQLPGTCAYPQILLNGGHGWVNATIEVDPSTPDQVIFRAEVEQTDAARTDPQGPSSTELSALATSYGWGGIPMMTLYDVQTNLPVLPWKEKI